MTANVPDDAGRLAERLLGPTDPELSCEECFDALDVYVERELAGAAGAKAGTEMPAMRAHLAGCSACRDDYDSLLALLRKGFGA